MHIIDPHLAYASTGISKNVWGITISEVEKIADVLLGSPNHSSLRCGADRAIVAAQKFGTSADMIPKEFQVLNDEMKSILGECGSNSPLFGAAFYHLRFENIHPLRDGNGRVGRFIMAAQCCDAYGISIQELLQLIEGHTNDYMMAMSAPSSAFQFELLVDVLARLLGLVPQGGIKAKFPLEPRFPQTAGPKMRKRAAAVRIRL